MKINYFVVDARTGRGIDRSLDRIKSRATRFTFSTCLPSIFFFFPPFFLPILLLFSSSVFFFATDTNDASCFFFFLNTFRRHTTKDDCVVRCGERGGERDGLAISRTKFFSRCLPVEKGFISTLRRKSRRRFEDSRVNSKRIFILE